MLTIQNLSYTHPNKDLLFRNINLIVKPNEKTALIGNNGAGKTTLLRIIAGELQPSDGMLKTDTKPYYIPQIFGQYNHLTIAEALGVGQKLRALREILNGNVSEKNYDLLNDDWTIEERCAEALNEWQLNGLDLSQKTETLSGGQKTKIFLAGISIHQPELVLLDEPSNHLDIAGRQRLYEFVRNEPLSLQIVSGERIAIKGSNGSGKTTLINVILGNLIPQIGTITVAESKPVYIDQDYSLINNKLKIYEQAQQFNASALHEHEVKIRLNRFLFAKDDWDKPCVTLSGGERMRLMLCCLSIADQSPDIIVLDEPTNNLDIRNIEILTKAINEYQGTLLVISHDETFSEQINIERIIDLSHNKQYP